MGEKHHTYQSLSATAAPTNSPDRAILEYGSFNVTPSADGNDVRGSAPLVDTNDVSANIVIGKSLLIIMVYFQIFYVRSFDKSNQKF